MTIFYADDDQEEIAFFCEAIKAIDCSIKCITAWDGAQALRLLDQIEIPDFIFLDLQMPRLNGRECLLHITSDDRLKDVPVIMYSTSVSPGLSEQLIKEGATKFLHKHCNIIELCDELRSILFKGRMTMVDARH
jgi:CheY-like chemotaxis protein